MGFLKKYISSRTKFEYGSEIKKDQKKELVMRTLLRISDDKLKLAENQFYSNELLGRVKDRLKLKHDSGLDPIQEHQAEEGGEFRAEESEKIL
ncbi:hypothetical protein PGT21_026885 [Puccinia graminis f. sp. tritici]|uniref:Uncharacterized protein n=1 Tax=Puccinia graminis f. sp. tritici TaxID=56615 RepID=A0A5B0SMA9_PUCGR|nr:hypothetical protein PGT21_026885 [Puccinia graminis f. sp. tritici]KAA1135051.1 hypothetical protein PGTUg99_015906 [Puccinia graminis f. sp. tritici]KAA1137674.1 hypothetical protein PGTUg99_023421 [Puccinia graminis f. sp. tritici]